MDKINVLVEYPEKIYLEECEYLEKIDLLGKGRIELKKFESSIEMEVERDSSKEEFKEKLSNATKRSNEVKERLTYNRIYAELQERINTLKKETDVHELRIARDKRVFRSAIALCNLLEKSKEEN